jgi:hypothetical protein
MKTYVIGLARILDSPAGLEQKGPKSIYTTNIKRNKGHGKLKNVVLFKDL